jgi:hypothetical protein
MRRALEDSRLKEVSNYSRRLYLASEVAKSSSPYTYGLVCLSYMGIHDGSGSCNHILKLVST